MLAYLGGTDIDKNGNVRSARAIKLSFIMNGSTEKLSKAARILSQVKSKDDNLIRFWIIFRDLKGSQIDLK